MAFIGQDYKSLQFGFQYGCCDSWIPVTLVNSKIFKLSLNLSFTHLGALIAFMN